MYVQERLTERADGKRRERRAARPPLLVRPQGRGSRASRRLLNKRRSRGASTSRRGSRR